jgi:hypothetical protein
VSADIFCAEITAGKSQRLKEITTAVGKSNLRSFFSSAGDMVPPLGDARYAYEYAHEGRCADAVFFPSHLLLWKMRYFFLLIYF